MPSSLAAGNPTPRRSALKPRLRALSPAEKGCGEVVCPGRPRHGKGRRRRGGEGFRPAVKADPSNRDYAADLQIASQHRVTKLVQDADKARLLGQPDVARAKLAEALALDPKNPEVSQHIYDLAKLESTASPDDSLNATFAPAIELTPKPGKQSFHFRSTEQEVLRRVLDAYGLRMVDDGSLASLTVRFDADDVDFAQAAHLLNLVDPFLHRAA